MIVFFVVSETSEMTKKLFWRKTSWDGNKNYLYDQNDETGLPEAQAVFHQKN